MVLGDADSQAVGDKHPAALLGKHAHVMDQVVRRLAVHGNIVVGKRVPAPPIVEPAHRALVCLVGPIVVFAGKADPAFADIHDAAVGQFDPPGVAVDVEAVAAVALQ